MVIRFYDLWKETAKEGVFYLSEDNLNHLSAISGELKKQVHIRLLETMQEFAKGRDDGRIRYERDYQRLVFDGLSEPEVMVYAKHLHNVAIVLKKEWLRTHP